MKSNLIFGAVLVAAVLAMHASGPQSVAYGQSVTAMPIVQDAFTDNKKGAIWSLYQEDATKCKVTETSGRLELTATANSSNTVAGYLSSGWWFKPTSDFAMKVDVYFDTTLIESASAWTLFGVSPSGQYPRENCAAVGIGSATGANYYRDELKRSTVVQTNYVSRERERVTLYISYSVAEDELYLSDSGYGSDYAWQVYRDLVWGEWYTDRLYVFLGGIANEALISSGHIYFDNFVVEQGVIGGIVPGDSTPTQPTDPTDPNAAPEDIIAPVVILPSVVKRNDASGVVTAAATLPLGIRSTDVKRTEMFVLTPGEIEANNQGTRVWINGQVIVWASFYKVELLEAVAENGVVNVQLTGWLKDGRKFTGVCPITIQ